MIRRRAMLPAALHNALYDLLKAAQFNTPIPRVRGTEAADHPWKVTVDDGVLGQRRVFISAGTVNDQPALFTYLAANDPRQWSPPPGYVALPSDPGLIDRDPLDIPDDPPCLLLVDPIAGATTSADWSLVTEAERNNLEFGAFTSADDWQTYPELWRTHILVSAAPQRTALATTDFPAPTLKRFRIYHSKNRPAPNELAEAGGMLELATLYLLRDPAQAEVVDVRVKQLVFHPLYSAVVQPSSQSATGLDDASASGGSFTSTAQVLFWTV